MRSPTIYEVLAEKLGRAPTDAECCAEVRRILGRDNPAPVVPPVSADVVVAAVHRHEHNMNRCLDDEGRCCYEPAPEPKRYTDRDETVVALRAALKRRGPGFGLKPGDLTVKTGRGTSWGWIKIDAAPRVFRDAKAAARAAGATDDDAHDAGRAAEVAVLRKLHELLGESPSRSSVSIPASSDYRTEYVDRAEGRAPRVIGKPYWD